MTAPVSITHITPNDDSALVSYTAVPGAKDYRAYTVDATGAAIHPQRLKYAGGSYSIEVNGLNPTGVNYVVIEAVDMLGPFQDCLCDPSTMASMDMIINGQGPATNMPNVIATSAPVQITCMPRTVPGTQVFFENFRNLGPIVQTPDALVNQECVTMNISSGNRLYNELETAMWSFRLFDHDQANTEVFDMSSHIMDILYPYHDILRAKFAMFPKHYPTLSGGNTLYLSFECDPHLDLNRTIGMVMMPASALLNYDQVTDNPTTHGPSIDCQFNGPQCVVSTGDGVKQTVVSDGKVDRWQQMWASGPMGGGLNGPGPGDLDKRHRFVFSVSPTHMTVHEHGVLLEGITFPVAQNWLIGQPLKIVFYHYAYHLAADHIYLSGPVAVGKPGGFMFPLQNYWLNERPASDERHWDNIEISVL
jgi:hypothetical protein